MNEERLVPAGMPLAARRRFAYRDRRDKILSRIASLKVVLDKASAFDDNADQVRALAEDRMAALAGELVEVLKTNPDRPQGRLTGQSAPLLEPVADPGSSQYGCARCGTQLGIAGTANGSREDQATEEWFADQVDFHEAGLCQQPSGDAGPVPS